MATVPDSSLPLPIVDLEKAKDPSQRLTVAQKLVEALETVGFLFIDNVEGFDAGKLLAHTQWFFNLSEQEKHRLARKLWNPESQNHYRGYFPLQHGESSYKEGFEIGQPVTFSSDEDSADVHPFFLEPNLWPGGMDGAEKFHEDIVKYYRTVLESGAEILRLVSLGCGLQENWFESMFFPNSLSTLRLLHYPPRPYVLEAAMDGDSALSCSEHSDSGFVTLLATFNYGGLEILKDDGKWMAVPCRPNSLVMNIGDMLSNMSGGKFKSTMHRVVETGVERFSVPFFFEPRYTADVTRLMLKPQEEKGAESQLMSVKPGLERYGPYLIEKMRTFAEYREILNSLSTAATPHA